MKPAPFDYVVPETAEDAVSCLQKYEDDGLEATILAGGQSFVPLLNMRMARPDVVVDLRKLTDLKYIREVDGMIAIGAMTTKREVEESELIQQRQPLLHASTVEIGHLQIRSRGTVGGSMAQADPAAEYPAVALALGMEMKILGVDGERIVPADEFFVTYLTTEIDSTEMLTEVRVPVLPDGTGWSFQELTRRHGDFAIVGGAVTLRLDGGVCTNPRIVLFGVGATPVRMTAAELALEGQAPSDELFKTVGEQGAAELEEPMSDVHATSVYRRHLAKVMIKRCLLEATERAGGSVS
ncbi:MAG: xanthine dehydrogenase family protein subunit M [Deltaproteobacteria bacterium]|nr:xanthine dehydrogenase family protein subunit M [Deltaproteobacteria bacterium]